MQKVKPGDDLEIYADDWNRVMAAVGRIEGSIVGVRPDTAELVPTLKIKVVNATKKHIGPFRALELAGVHLVQDNSGIKWQRSPIFSGVLPSGRPDKIIAIIQSGAGDGEIVDAVIAGATFVRLKNDKVTGPGLTPDSEGYFINGDAVTMQGTAYKLSTDIVLGCTVLGGGGGMSSGYDGYFKLIFKPSDNDLKQGTIDVVYGAYPAADVCGFVHIGGTNKSVAKATGISANGDTSVYLRIEHLGDGELQFEISSIQGELPGNTDSVEYCMLGSLIDGKVYQSQEGEIFINWRLS